ncbi:HigA family addiction module antidote protein [Sphingobium sp. TB-6]|uniref:HigA family addiction module antitoxin n=1 Tax=Sphingobium sp. TB-6 TaxID=2728850 RepID=UPI00146A5225|nr:HigA family addiction module antitoxin [Sphingobium sp. TB-6]NML89171.1 HigA family addiction module antidote protein [Sphingobium sp. TB-6]
MAAIADIRLKNPAHPGGFIKHEIIEPLARFVTAAAEVLGVTCATHSTLLNERVKLSPEMALRIEKALGVLIDTRKRMQNSHDITQTHKREAENKDAPYKGKLVNQPSASI